MLNSQYEKNTLGEKNPYSGVMAKQNQVRVLAGEGATKQLFQH